MRSDWPLPESLRHGGERLERRERLKSAFDAGSRKRLLLRDLLCVEQAW
jgi:hypothetical protein